MNAAPIVLAHEEPFRIGEAAFLPATREVRLNGSRSIVEPRVMQLLVALYRAGGGVLTKDELLQQCWNGRIVGEDAINRVVSRLRSVAENHAGRQFSVETITKVGYRLASASPLIPPSARLGETRTHPRVRRRDMIIGGAALSAVSAGGLGWGLTREGGIPSEARVLVDDARNSLYQFTPDQIENAIGKLRRATQVSPDSAEAWGLLALAYANSTYHTPLGQRANRFARSEESRQKAFAIEADQPDALAAQLGTSRVFGNWFDQERQCRAALRRHPDHPVLQVTLGHLLLEVGRFEEALPLFEDSLQKTPLCVTSLSSRVVILSGLNRFEEADTAMERAFGLMPRQPAIWFTRAHYLTYTGRAGEAGAMIADRGSRPQGLSEWNFQLVALQADAVASGDRDLIDKTTAAYGEAARRGAIFAENAATFAAFVGRGQEAFRILNALYFNRGFSVLDAAPDAVEGMYSGHERRTGTLFRQPIAAIRRAPRFTELTKDLGLEDYWARTGTRRNVVT